MMAVFVRNACAAIKVGSTVMRQSRVVATLQVRGYFNDRRIYDHNQRPFLMEQKFDDLSEYPLPHHVMMMEFKTDTEKLEKGIWPWNKGIRERIPEHFKKRFIERYTTKPKPVHFVEDQSKWRVDEYGTRHRVQNIPIPVLYPPEADQGLWGGEGLVRGLRKKGNNPMKTKTPRVWKPRIYSRVLYSEILNQYLEIKITLRTLDLIDEAFGFDHYILKTHEVDLRSRLGMKLKQAMLTKLGENTLNHENVVRREEIYNKYKHYIIPMEEVPWLSLTLEEAERMQEETEEAERQASIRPMKEVYAEELVEKFKNMETSPTEDGGWFSKLNPFKDSEKQ